MENKYACYSWQLKDALDVRLAEVVDALVIEQSVLIFEELRLRNDSDLSGAVEL